MGNVLGRCVRPVTALLLAGLLSFCLTAPGRMLRQPSVLTRQESFRPVSAFVIVFDEFPIASIMNRRGHVDSRLFPNFRRL